MQHDSTTPSNIRAQALTEIIIGLTISAIVVAAVAAAIAITLRSNQENAQFLTATFLAQEYADEIQAIAEGSWHEAYLKSPKGATSTYRIAASGTQLIVQPGAATTSIDSIEYTRYFSIENVSRDGGGAIESTYSAANDDPSTQKIAITVEWTRGGDTRQVTMAKFVTRWRNKAYRQTDWSGGPGVEGPTSDPGNTFATSTNIDFSETGSIYLEGFGPSPVLEDVLDGLIAHWKLDESSGGIAYDSSVNANDGISQGGVIQGAQGQVDGAAEFDGTVGSYFDVGRDDSTKLQYPMSITAWINMASLPGTSPFFAILARDGAGSNRQFEFRVQDAYLNLSVYPSGTTTGEEGIWADAADVFTVDDLEKWFFVAGTFTAQREGLLYINGILSGPGATIVNGNVSASNVSSTIGGAYRDDSWRADGLIDDVRVYNRALSADEVSQIYEYHK